MNLFLDASVILAACESQTGASRAVYDMAASNGWVLLTSPYVITEVSHNLPRLSGPAISHWARLRGSMELVRDVWTMDRPAVFGPAKDRPVLFTAAAWADTLLTLDRGDFDVLMGVGFYGLHVTTPGEFLTEERTAGRLK